MRLETERNMERGDTIIEVIFAVAIFSFVAISSLTIMNQGIAIGERALEITLVRQQVHAQAEALRFIHEARVVGPSSTHADTWRRLVTDYGQTVASSYGMEGSECALPEGGSYKPFILNARTAQIWGSAPIVAPSDPSLPPYSQVAYSADDSSIQAAYGIWVESVPSSSLMVKKFVDFHIRACWPAPSGSQPMTMGTIVRLYDPTV